MNIRSPFPSPLCKAGIKALRDAKYLRPKLDSVPFEFEGKPYVIRYTGMFHEVRNKRGDAVARHWD